MEQKLYGKRNRRKLGEYYARHVMAMTAEGLHEKADIAAELAWRDFLLDGKQMKVVVNDN